MNSLQIEDYISSDKYSKNNFFGVKACDELTNFKFKKKGFVIVNSCELKKNNPYSCHWILIGYFNKKYFYFDTFGISSLIFINKFIANFFKKSKEKIFVNQQRIQDYGSSNCGHFCISTIALLCRGYSFSDILLLYDKKNFKKNDKIVEGLCKTIFKNYI